eukprot:scaffold43391_cov65-Phaeocystis_antarctica.AAC.4
MVAGSSKSSDGTSRDNCAGLQIAKKRHCARIKAVRLHSGAPLEARQRNGGRANHHLEAARLHPPRHGAIEDLELLSHVNDEADGDGLARPDVYAVEALERKGWRGDRGHDVAHVELYHLVAVARAGIGHHAAHCHRASRPDGAGSGGGVSVGDGQGGIGEGGVREAMAKRPEYR